MLRIELPVCRCTTLVGAGLLIASAALGSEPSKATAGNKTADHAQSLGLEMATRESVGMSSERLERVSRMMPGYIDPGEVAGTVTSIARHGKVVHFEEAEDGILMTQVRHYSQLNIRQDFANTTYQAIVE